MKLPARTTSSRSSAGQALVEFAMILPILVLLLVVAIDFGRVFFGWVGVHNVARIGADYAALHPLDGDWSDPDDPNTQGYVDRMLADAEAINCELPDPIPLPTFPEGTSPGDDAVVSLTCGFEPITPGVIMLIGSPLQIGAEATFAIRKGIVDMPDSGGGEEEEDPLCRVVPDLDGMVASDAEVAWEVAGFSGTFSFSGAASDVVVDDSQITNPASVPGQCISFEATVSVSTVTATLCPSGESLVPELTGLLVSQARTRWENNGFSTTNFLPEPGSADEEAVAAWATDPPFDAGDCAPSGATTIEVDHQEAPDPAPCRVPDFIGTQASAAQTTWSTAGFTTTVQFSSAGKFKVGKQSINASAPVSCTSSVIVLEPKGAGNS